MSYIVEGKNIFVSLTISSMDAELALEVISEKGKQIEASLMFFTTFSSANKVKLKSESENEQIR